MTASALGSRLSLRTADIDASAVGPDKSISPRLSPTRFTGTAAGIAAGRRARIDSVSTPTLSTPTLSTRSPNTEPGGRTRATRGGQLGDAWASGGTNARLDRHQALLERQQVQIDVLREEALVLRDCLTRSGSMSMDHFLMALHRQRFASIRRSHPICSDADLEQSLGTRELVTAVARSLGPAAVHALRSASASVNQAVSDVLPTLGPVFSNCLYVFGGFDGTEECQRTAERFDPLSGVWEPLPQMIERRSLMGSAVIGRQLYVCGGYSGKVALTFAERFNPAAGAWEPLPSMSQRRASAACAVLGGYLFMCGGFDGERILSSVERLDPVAAVWEPQSDMACCRKKPAAAMLGNSLYVCGGSSTQEGVVGSYEAYLRSSERFDLCLGAWETIPSMTVRRGHASAVSVAHMVYVCGGFAVDATIERAMDIGGTSAERFDPAANVWEPLPSMSNVRIEPAVAVAAGKIYVCGGRDGDGTRFLSSAERFDPSSGQWQALRPMSARRNAASAAVLEGRLYVCGGHDGAEFRRSVERFDPESGVWELLPPMRSRRSSANAVALWSFVSHWLLEPPTVVPAQPPAPHSSGGPLSGPPLGGPPLGGIGALPGEFGADSVASPAPRAEGLPTPPSMLGTPNISELA
jgi:N-acetylneuraminic acid mutarotase